MSTDSCLYFYECESCKTRLKPLAGDFCVFWSYGTIKCPPIQQGVSLLRVANSLLLPSAIYPLFL
ncbi:GDCCVxC domain-containing (seleno)protein [Taibaiella koreensis]